MNGVGMNWKRIIKIILLVPLVIILSLAIIVGCYVGYLMIPDRIRIVTTDGSASKEIPYFSIVLPQDCQKYKEWLLGNIPPMLWPEGGLCPFEPLPEDRIGHFINNAVKLNIPRNYFLFSPNEPDGELNHISLLMQYPSMKPATGMPKEEGQDYNVRVTIRPRLDPEGNPQDVSQFFYESRTGIDSNRVSGKENSFKLIKRHEDLGLDEYDINGKPNHFYLKGNPLKPNYWVMCNPLLEATTVRPSCEGWFNYNNQIYINYFFGKFALLPNHGDLRQKIIEKIEAFKMPTLGEEKND